VALLVSAFGTAASAPTTIKLTTGDWLSPRPRVAAFQLIDDGGQSFTQANLAGHWSMLLFGYTHCTDVCPATLAILASLERRELAAGREGPRVLFVSADVARDTPRDLQAFVRRFNRAFVGLTALDQRSIDQLARTLDTAVVVHGESRGNYSVDHTGAIFVVDPRGALAAVLTGPMTPAALQADFDRIVVAAR
jgi:protein SCO1/2